ncbi:ubiquinone anaerobic biosynthesis accessory factor UbiT [Thiothrix fructosivorans]|uniref:Ubiquinone biosynthesis accessory factor UbiT n=2 Tax=Thiothrix fructosivorans TaxID=111770 RepID=A0A8B0SPX0_9GAMM|nr:SCP2 sterol-binding domain-containing protein [Thiothrix fructosivorans]MBO0611469.1 SCP2 sterol-binding domain-containing protein [Thiothrix fructosivorans]QTX12974.1 SCP2 sterol-binding domain-containing protein [Thiothrix fructosivorans]
MIAFPSSLAALISRLPAYPPSLTFATAFNLTVWKSLQDLEWEALQDRRFCVAVRDTGIKLWFSMATSGLKAETAGQADVTFTATLLDFTRLALRLEDPDTLFFNRRLLIEGDTDLGLRVKNMLDGVEFETLLESFPSVLGRLVNQVRKQGMA